MLEIVIENSWLENVRTTLRNEIGQSETLAKGKKWVFNFGQGNMAVTQWRKSNENKQNLSMTPKSRPVLIVL